MEYYINITWCYFEQATQAYSYNLYKCPAPVQYVISLDGVWYCIWYDRAHKHKVIINKSARTCKTDNSLAEVNSHSWLPLSAMRMLRSASASNWCLSSAGECAEYPKNTRKVTTSAERFSCINAGVPMRRPGGSDIVLSRPHEQTQ